MTYEVKFSKKAEKAYKKLPGNIRLRIDQKINYLRLTQRNLLVMLMLIGQGLAVTGSYTKLKTASY